MTNLHFVRGEVEFTSQHGGKYVFPLSEEQVASLVREFGLNGQAVAVQECEGHDRPERHLRVVES